MTRSGSWDCEMLPHAWIWIEVLRDRRPFGGPTEIVAIEPCSVQNTPWDWRG